MLQPIDNKATGKRVTRRSGVEHRYRNALNLNDALVVINRTATPAALENDITRANFQQSARRFQRGWLFSESHRLILGQQRDQAVAHHLQGGLAQISLAHDWAQIVHHWHARLQRDLHRRQYCRRHPPFIQGIPRDKERARLLNDFSLARTQFKRLAGAIMGDKDVLPSIIHKYQHNDVHAASTALCIAHVDTLATQHVIYGIPLRVLAHSAKCNRLCSQTRCRNQSVPRPTRLHRQRARQLSLIGHNRQTRDLHDQVGDEVTVTDKGFGNRCHKDRSYQRDQRMENGSTDACAHPLICCLSVDP